MTTTNVTPSSDKLFEALCKKMQSNSEISLRINTHIRAISSHNTIVNYHNNGAPEPEKVQTYAICLKSCLDNNWTRLSGQVANGQAQAVEDEGDDDDVIEVETETVQEPPSKAPEKQVKAVQTEQPASDLDAALATIRHALNAPRKAELDAERVKQIVSEEVGQTVTAMEDRLSAEIESVSKAGQLIGNVIDIANQKIAELEAKAGNTATDIQQAVTDALQSSVGKAISDGLIDGSLVVIPATLPVDSYYVRNDYSFKIERAIKKNQSIIISGPSGSGKTFPAEQELRMLGRKYLGPISMGEGFTKKDFMARETLSNEGGHVVTKWKYGFLPFAMMNGLVLIMDEISQTQRELLSHIYFAMEYGRLTLTETGETITAKDGFMIIGTDNSLTDSTGLYSGYGLSVALTNRFKFVKADYMENKDEIQVFERIGVSNQVAVNLRIFLDKCRCLYKSGSITFAPSTRVGVSACKEIIDGMTMLDAVAYVMTDGLPDSESKKLLALL